MSFSLNELEQTELNKYKHIIVWGFPLHTHTHSYIHAMWIKVFKDCFNKSVHWFEDNNYPKDFDYNDCIFITEGYCERNIPVLETSVYFVHNALDPEKYLSKKARLIEIRFNVMEIHDVNNDFNLKDGTHNNIIYLSNETKYEKLTNNKDIYYKKRNNTITPMNYECIYLFWATDLLPHEFDFTAINNIPENKIYYIGSNANSNHAHEFRNVCVSRGIEWIRIDPWSTPISFEENRKLMQKSLLCPDFRPSGTTQDEVGFGKKNGKNHLEIGYLPCRVLKAISYGKIGLTNSIHVKNILKEHVIYNDNMEKLFEEGIREINNHEKILAAMKHVQENHTYFHRARDLIRALLQK